MNSPQVTVKNWNKIVGRSSQVNAKCQGEMKRMVMVPYFPKMMTSAPGNKSEVRCMGKMHI